MGLNGDWLPSSSISIKPGEKIYSLIKYHANNKTFELYIENTNSKESVTTNFSRYQNLVFDQVFFVLEHQPEFYDAYPAAEQVLFTDIHVQWEGDAAPVKDPQW